MTYGFIITRHVNSEETNKYWNQSVILFHKQLGGKIFPEEFAQNRVGEKR